MALIPQNIDEDEADLMFEESEAIAPTKTWAIDFENGRIRSFIDDTDALRQFIAKALLTTRSKHVIYSDDYGNELQSLVGSDMTPALLDSEIPRMVREALIYDDRIDDVAVTYQRKDDRLYISATVIPANADVEITEEVVRNV